MKETIGYCKFCKQSTMVMVPDNATPEEIEKEATMSCKCKLSQEYADKIRHEESVQMSIEAAKASVDQLFEGEQFDELRTALKGCIDSVAKKKIRKVTIDINKKIKATIQIKDDAILLTRTETEKFEQETSIG
jgi:uncharacterized protein YajQ (UPF0234 family)